MTIYEYQKGLLFRNGKFIKVLGSGSHWYIPMNSSISIYDMRPFQKDVKNQEILSLDGVPLKISIAFEYQIDDLYKAYCLNQKPSDSLYLELQLLLRNVISSKPIEDILNERNELAAMLKPGLEKKSAELGLKITSFGIKDISFPKEIKDLFAKVIKAKKEGQASLERARNEQAALRSLANAATMLKDNPDLLSIRKIHAIESSKSIVNI